MPRPARRAVLLLVVLLLAVAAVTALVLVRSRPPTGAEVAAGSERFRSCYEDAGPGALGLDGAQGWDRGQEQRFWAQPQALDCAVARFEEPVRRRALQEAFLAPDDGGDAPAQREVVRDYATWLAAEEGLESAQVLLRAGAVLRATWVAGADDDTGAATYAETAVLADLAAQGDLPGYAAWREAQGRDDDAAALDDYLDDELVQDRPEDEAPYRLLLDRADALLQVVR